MPKSIGRGLVGAGAILLAILLTGCSDTPSPTPSAEAVPSPTVTAQPGVTPEPTPAAAAQPGVTPEPTPAAATLSLYEYLTQCAPPEQELADDAAYGDVSVLAAELIQRLEAMVPPADLVEWHHLYIELFRTVQAMYDRFPKDDVIDNAKMDEFLLAVAPDLEEKLSGLEEKLSEIAVRLPEHLRQQMIEVDCLDPDIVPDDYDEPDDHGNNFKSATRIAIGEAVAIELEFRLDKDVLVFLAEPGTEYEFTLDWESYSRSRSTARPILALFDAGGQELARLNHYVFGSQDKMMWQAVTRGDYYIVVGDTVTDGSITLTVTDGEATEQLDRDDATVAPTHTPTPVPPPAAFPVPVPPPAAATLSLYEYLTQCAPPEQELADDAAYGDFSSLFAAEADRLEAMVPPADLVEWHHLYIELFRTVQAMFNRFPKDDVIDNAKIDEFLLAVAPDLEEKYSGLEEKLSEIAVRLPEHLRQQMIEVGCLDPDIVPDDYDEPDDHGNNFKSATRIAIGEAVAIELEFRLDKDVLVFLAEPGTEYEFTLDWESYSRSRSTARPILALFDAGGQELARVFGSQDKMMWQAVTRGDYYIVVGDTVTDGSITLTVTDGEATEQLDRDDATVAPTHTPTPVPPPAAFPVPVPPPAAATFSSLDEYLTLCATTEQELADDATFGDFSSLFAAEADRLEALTPPVQLSEWHLLNMENFRTIQAFVDLQPKDDVIDVVRFLLMAAISADSEEKLRAAAARLPEDVRQQMIEAGCIDPEDVPDDHEDVPDDHGNDIDDATAIRVGTEVRGAVDYDDDIDYFRFQAEQGESYQIDVALGTLDDSIVELYDADGSFLETNDDYGGTFASRLYWEAPSNGVYGVYYVAVTGFYGVVGTYTLMVSIDPEDVPDDHEDVPDDHGNDIDDATAIRVGTEVRGAVDYDDDIDYFRFQAEQGESYQIDVALGTLDDSIVELYDADGSFLETNDDYGGTFASRLYWEAPSNGVYGVYYVAVTGFYGVVGTYTLMVSIVDDHGNDLESATRIAIGEDVRIALHDYDDRDVLVFSARPGTEYVFTLDYFRGVRRGEAAGTTMALYDAGGRVLARLSNYDFSSNRSKIMWQAATGGDLYIVVGNEDAYGIFSLTVTEG